MPIYYPGSRYYNTNRLTHHRACYLKQMTSMHVEYVFLVGWREVVWCKVWGAPQKTSLLQDLVAHSDVGRQTWRPQ